MKKFKALVADDEFIIRRGIESFLKKYDDFEITAEAEDGEMALELAAEAELDVCFVDINMPFINGLEFIRKLKEVQPDVLIIIITGYDKFEYAKEALRLGTFEYLLKPVMENEFNEMIGRVRKQLFENTQRKEYEEWARNTLDKKKALLISDFLCKVLNGEYRQEEIEKQAEYLNLELPEQFLITVIKLDYQKSEDVKGIWDQQLIWFAADNMANEIFNNFESIRSCRDEHGNLVVISKRLSDKEEAARRYSEALEACIPVKCLLVQREGEGRENYRAVYEEAAGNLEKTKENPSVLKEVKELIEQRYSEESLSLSDIAEEVNLSMQYLGKIFKKEEGMTFSEYLTNIRIHKSIELFKTTDLRMYEVAEKVGYSTQHYFCNVFKKTMGISPSEFRKQNK